MDKETMKKVLAGLFFFVGIALVSGVVLVIGIEKGLLQPKFQMAVLFQEVGGLSIGAPVTVSGVRVGTVAGVDFLDHQVDGRTVTVTLNIFEKYKKQLRKSERFSIITEGILGEKLVAISINEDIHRMDLGQPVVGEDPLDVQDLANTFGEAATAFSETSTLINDMIEEVRRISNTSKRLLNRIEQRVIEGNLFRIF